MVKLTRIRHVRFADEKLRGTWKTVFPTRDGELLNLRDLEQGLEQMKRVSSQDVSMEIVPADVPGDAAQKNRRRSSSAKKSLVTHERRARACGVQRILQRAFRSLAQLINV